jgi:hypothetical protein
MEWVWLNGGIAQDSSPGVMVFDTDISDFPDDLDLAFQQGQLQIAHEIGAPDWLIETIEGTVEAIERRIEEA